MDEDSGVKAAPVTRLRRRLSIEAEETKSPSTPSTPTKKRTTRLAAKPQLELIDEHAVTNSPKRSTRKSISRDIVEPDEKPMTPARRNTRTKSNTSIVSEAEDKPLTPARRSTRTKSNTSLVSEAGQSIESPRAKRAVARRNSQVGSDNEAPLTPARTRRARKASTSSIDKEETPSVSETAVTPGRVRRSKKGSASSIDVPAEAALAEKPSLITEVIVEEPESKDKKSTSDKDNFDIKDDSPTRKSPRLMAKKSRKSKSEDVNEIQKQSQEQNDSETTSNIKQLIGNAQVIIKNDISLSSANLIKDLDIFSQIQKKISNKNKSMSDIEETESKKRNRTKSWTTLRASSPPIGDIFYSDNENKKKKLKKNDKIFNEKRHSSGDDTGSGDGVNQIASTQKINNEPNCNMPKKNRKSINDSVSNKSGNIDKSLSEATKHVDLSNRSNKEKLGLTPVTKNTSGVEHLFENVLNADVKSLVFMEDSDSNSLEKQEEQINEDQCVPIIYQNQDNASEKQASTIFALNNMGEEIKNDDSVEPMDIDETLPENVSLTVSVDKGKLSRKSSLCMSQEVDDVSRDTLNKSRKKSSSHFISQIIDDSKAKDGEVQNEKASKLSVSVTHEADNSFDDSRNKSKKNWLSHLILDDQAENKKKDKLAESQNVSKDESMSGIKSRKSSIMVTQESDNSITENFNKSQKKSKSISQDNNVDDTNYINDINSFYNKSNEVIATEENLSDKIKSSISIAQDSDNLKEIKSKSKRKSLFSNSITHDKTGNGDKSTLKLSQIKDISAAENSVSDSPRHTTDLSKSINIVETSKDGPVNKNLTLNYLTSTPVQQKSFNKLAMPMNTSVITPTDTSKNDIKMSKNKPQRNGSLVSKSSANESSDEDSKNSDEEDSSQDKSNLFNDEAEDAGEDYKSGDSQDEEERQFERENEIIDKGETLTSEEEISDDSDYEKDSFVVSSDEEDNEMLSGSGDDLNSSDNELTFNAKSKKKYNERKLKEQKKASKEMYEARHGLNVSAKDAKSKKKNRTRLDSTLLKSDEDILPPKKNKRMRLESTLETSQTKSDTEDVNNDVSVASDKDEIGYKKKKSKRLSESVYSDSVVNEKEITIHNQEEIQNDDPLSVQIKTEPKTPQKDLEISRVHVTDDVEHVHVDENKSMMKLYDTNDPLQATVVQEEIESSDDDSISENEEITKNYDSVLKELNKESKNLIKSHDISLNLIQKDKRKIKKTIIDELNLTQTKTSKKDNSLLAKEKSVKRVFKKLADTDESSDSIDLQLLFSDDSNGTNNDNHSKNKGLEGPDAKVSFISLKKTKAKIDIHQSIGERGNDDEGLLNFFIDTKGDFEDNTPGNYAAVDKSDSDEAPVEVLYVSEKKKNSLSLMTPASDKKKILESQESNLQGKTLASKKDKKLESHENGNETLKTPVSEKKKKMILSCETAAVPESVSRTPVELKKEKKSPKSQKKSISSEKEEMAVTVEDTMNRSRNRKRKQSASKTADDIEYKGTAQVLNTSHQLSESVCGNKKKKLKISTSTDDSQIQTNVSTTGVKNTKKEQTTALNHRLVDEKEAGAVSERDTKSSKKRKERDEDKGGNVAKVFKENSFAKVHVPRLPPTIIEQLVNLPSESLHKKTKSKAVSTSNFTVEETKKRKNKPSDFMEETVCLNDDNSTPVKKKTITKKLKVLPFLPTVSTSDSGFTTNFRVNVISEKMEFVAQRDDIPNFKNDYLNNKRIKKLRTYDLYKKQRNVKLSKY